MVLAVRDAHQPEVIVAATTRGHRDPELVKGIRDVSLKLTDTTVPAGIPASPAA